MSQSEKQMDIETCPALTVDCVVFDVEERLLLIKRKNKPFVGQYALPGGFVQQGERTEDAALRELKEETGIEAKAVELVGVYSNPGRDPRGHVVSIAYLIRLPAGADLKAGTDAASASFVADWKDIEFAFDHAVIVMDAVRKKGGSL